jgi:hypothetical protein
MPPPYRASCERPCYCCSACTRPAGWAQRSTDVPCSTRAIPLLFLCSLAWCRVLLQLGSWRGLLWLCHCTAGQQHHAGLPSRKRDPVHLRVDGRPCRRERGEKVRPGCRCNCASALPLALLVFLQAQAPSRFFFATSNTLERMSLRPDGSVARQLVFNVSSSENILSAVSTSQGTM